MKKPGFSAGRNVAMKIPPAQYQQTVDFYAAVLGLTRVPDTGDDVVFEFSGMRLWLDRVAGLDDAELWLEIRCDDIDEAEHLLATAGVERCDEVEKLPAGFEGFWIRNPAGLVHLVCTGD